MKTCKVLAAIALIVGGCGSTQGAEAPDANGTGSTVSTDTGTNTATSTGTGQLADASPPATGTDTTTSTGTAQGRDAASTPDSVSPAPDLAPPDSQPASGPDATAPVSDGGPAEVASPPDAGPSMVTVRFVGALIGPSKANGDPWDSDGSSISADGKTALAQALLGVNPYAAVLAVMSGPLLSPVAKPEPYGTVTAETAKGSETLSMATAAEAPQDSFTLQPPLAPGWSGVPLNQDVRFLVNLSDVDLVYDDPIGTAEINMDDVRAALASKQVYHVNVADQTFNTILFVDISVIAN